jgi:DNA-binding transcriptional LysR family regulator
MEMRNLRAFVQVVNKGGFSAAAKVLGTTQPTVSKAIVQLEHDCGFPLLDRLGRGVRMTAAGESVYRRGLAILAEHENLLGDLADLKGLKRGQLKLGIPPLGSGPLFASLIAEYRRRYPQIEILLREEGSHRLKEAVLAGEIELGASLLPVEDEFLFQEMRDDPIMVLLPLNHPLAQRDSLKLKELSDAPFILFEAGFALNELIVGACQNRGFTPMEAARSSHSDFITALVASGLGIGFLPRTVVSLQSHFAVRSIVLDEPDVRWRLGLIWQRHTNLSPAAESWIELVRESGDQSHRNTSKPIEN